MDIHQYQYDDTYCRIVLLKSIWTLIPTASSISDENMVQENNPEVGGWGGTCRCPDGALYQVGDNIDFCESLACTNGEMVDCNRSNGEWSKRKVSCAGIR